MLPRLIVELLGIYIWESKEGCIEAFNPEYPSWYYQKFTDIRLMQYGLRFHNCDCLYLSYHKLRIKFLTDSEFERYTFSHTQPTEYCHAQQSFNQASSCTW